MKHACLVLPLVKSKAPKIYTFPCRPQIIHDILCHPGLVQAVLPHDPPDVPFAHDLSTILQRLQHPSASIDSMMLLKNLFYRQDVFPFLPDPPVSPLLRLLPAAAHGLPQPRHFAHLPHRITGAVREDRFALHSGGCIPPHNSASRAFSGERQRGTPSSGPAGTDTFPRGARARPAQRKSLPSWQAGQSWFAGRFSVLTADTAG